MSSFCSFVPSTKRSHPELDLKMVRSVVELDCMMAVTGYTSTVLCSRRVAVVNFVADQSCKIEDMLDRCSS